MEMNKSQHGEFAPPPAQNSYPPNTYPPNAYPEQQGNPVVITPSVVVSFGPESQPVVCPYCHHSVSTKVESKATTKTHMIALILCVCLCWPCCVCPYCIDSCKGRNHSCPQCNAFLGTYNK